MKSANRWPLLLVALLIVALGVLATLQTRWINEVNRAQEQRLRAEVEGAARRFSEEIDRELLHVVSILEVRRANPAELSERYIAWASTAHNPRLVAAIFVFENDSLRRLDPQNATLSAVEWPPALAMLRGHFKSFEPDVPAFIMPMRGEREAEWRSHFLIIQFDAGELTHRMMPELAHRLFATDSLDGFDVAVTRGESIAYRSNPSWPAQIRGAQADLVWPIVFVRRKVSEMRAMPEVASSWRLLVRHHGQPLAEVISAARRRDRAIAFAILGLLGASVVILAAAARRAERLRRQQLEFVAGITHELNTPLAALASAGQNLADGLPVDTARYGATVVKETRRLIDLVDQVLQFSGMETRVAKSRQEVIDPRAAIDDAIAQCRVLAEEREVRVEADVAATIPNVRGDRVAVTRAVQNLVANAIRHGGEGGWVGVRAGVDDGFVAITVEDRGAGIAAADLPHLFEPFYRGRNAQTRGSGIGLTIVDRIARAHGGSVTVVRKRERGAEFRLRLPSAESRP